MPSSRTYSRKLASFSRMRDPDVAIRCRIGSRSWGWEPWNVRSVVQPAVALVDRPGDDEEASRLILVAREVLGLGSLVRPDDVLDGERVQPVLLGEGLDDLHPVEPVDIDPADVRPGWPMAGEELAEVVDLLDLDLVRAVV